MKNDLIWVLKNYVPDEIINEFDCSDETFNYFFKEKSDAFQANGECVTYCFISETEFKRKQISRIYAYASINTMALLYENTDDVVKYLSCVEIKMFAIARFIRGQRDEHGIKYSRIIFKSLMQELYGMSVNVIGFHAIYLNANKNGLQLYKDCGFENIQNYIPASEEEKIDIEGCVPLLLIISDESLYDIFL